MPRVTDEHREHRRRQILDAARSCFVHRGFHQTTMHDILRAAGLSAGAVYGYFRSKEEIIAAIASEVVGYITGLLDQVAASQPPPPLPQVMARVQETVEDLAFGPDGFAYIAPQVWAEATHNDQVHAVVAGEYAKIRAVFVRLVRAEQAVGRIDPDTDAEVVAPVVLGSVMGYILQRVLFGSVDPQSYSAGLAALSYTPQD